MRTIPPELPHHTHLADGLLLGHVAHTAGVEQNHIGFGFIRDKLISALGEHFRHLIGVALIHLAAVGFDVDAGHFGGGEFVADRRWGQGQVRSNENTAETSRWRRSHFFTRAAVAHSSAAAPVNL